MINHSVQKTIPNDTSSSIIIIIVEMLCMSKLVLIKKIQKPSASKTNMKIILPSFFLYNFLVGFF